MIYSMKISRFQTCPHIIILVRDSLVVNKVYLTKLCLNASSGENFVTFSEESSCINRPVIVQPNGSRTGTTGPLELMKMAYNIYFVLNVLLFISQQIRYPPSVTFLKCKYIFKTVCMLPSDILVSLLIIFTLFHQFFAAAMITS